ncbi:MAG: hypothetical protein GVX90_05375, partial [Alphaproteobacteria bacterium]|nr:hypothetical protein [Alphaproteobacteria bacterium]
DPATLVAGISLLVASLAALFAARAVPRPLGDPKAAVNFALAFVTFEIGLLAYALAFGDPAMFAPEIVGAVGLNEAVWFVFLWAGWQLLGLIVPSAHADPAAGSQA